jgi:PKD repeat protein/type 1 glutamine amidotransferase
VRRMRQRFALAGAIGCAALAAAVPSSALADDDRDRDHDDEYRVLVLTKGGDPATTAVGVKAIRAAGDDGDAFKVTVADDASRFTEASLERYRTVVFLNSSGDVLDAAQQDAFEAYFRNGGGFVGIHRAIEAEPDWAFMSNILGTRAGAGGPSAVVPATVKVADRGHEAGRRLPEYWKRTDRFYNFSSNVRGRSHVLATVDETTYAGGSMGANHPISWCKDYQGGRSFYTGIGGTAAAYGDRSFRDHIAGAVEWAAGEASTVYSDCGATVLANYQQTKISAPPNLNEPIGFDQLPDGRVIQTARAGQLRLHDPVTQSTTLLATIPVYTNSEDGLYGPAVDKDFATNKWVYLFYAPPTVTIEKCDGTTADVTTPTGSAPTVSADPCVWKDTWGGYFQLSRFKFVEGTASSAPTLDLTSEQKIMQVANNRGACCHVAGDIDFDKQGNLWLVTGDDTPAGGGNSGGFAPFNDQRTNENQTVRTLNATGGTFTITFDGQTTGPIPFNASNAQTLAALEALSNVAPGDVVVTGNPLNTANQTINFRGAFTETDVPQITTDASGLTGGATPPTAPAATTQQGNLFNSPHVDARRSAYNTNDLRGKVLRIKVDASGSYSVPKGNLFPESRDVAGKTRPEIYAMGFRNPFRIQVDDDGVAYVTDYSPDSQTPQQFRGPAGTGRVEIVRKPSNYGWPVCYAPNLPYYPWNFNTSLPLNPADPQPFDCANAKKGPDNTSRWNTGLTTGLPPITQPDVWYSYRDNQTPPLGTPCLAYYGPDPLGTCPQLFPELGTGGVGPHGADVYEFDRRNPNPKKFPAYYDGAVFFGEFTRDTLKEIRLDSQNRVFKINNLLDCGAAPSTTLPFECDNPMDMQFGSDGAFYLLTYGDGFFAANADAGMYKWEYVKGQRTPRAVLTTDRTDGQAPLTVRFSSEGSNDPDPGESIRFDWDFGDGTTSVDPSPEHVYAANGVYTARLTITDSSGKTDTKTTVVTVGNTSPTVSVNVPLDGDFFQWGDDIPWSVSVSDPEDGAIDCNRVKVTFVLVHDQHGHAQTDQLGCSGVLPTDADDASHGGYIAGAVSASYTDLGANGQPALTTIDQNVVQVRRQQVEYVQQQLGTTVAAAPAAEPDPGGGQVRGSLDPGDWLALNNGFNLANMDKRITFRFAGGSAATVGQPRAAVEIREGAADGPLVTTVTLAATSGNNAYGSQTFDLPLVGTKRLYLVFRAVAGGPATGFGNLNWVEFSGPGAGVPAA